MTVTGKVSANSLGVVLPHEHAFIDLRPLVPAPRLISAKVLAQEQVTLANLGKLHRNPYAVLDNAVLDDEAVMQEELLAFKKAGGTTIVDLTLRDIGRDPELLARLSRALDIRIVAGCGYYIEASHPADMDGKTVDEIASEMLHDIQYGMEGTKIRAGVIGEIGTSEIIYPNERKTLIAAAAVQQQTGLGLHVHTDLWAANGYEVIQILSEQGAASDKICINHIDVDLRLDYLKGLLDKGVYIEFDNFGKEFYSDKRHRSVLRGIFARDIDRVRAIKTLIDAGHLSRILISTDVCLKTCLNHYGGWGYDHILTNIVPMMEDEGITPTQIQSLIRDNPAAFLDDGRD
jgi:phosphotriesterase-related protein